MKDGICGIGVSWKHLKMIFDWHLLRVLKRHIKPLIPMPFTNTRLKSNCNAVRRAASVYLCIGKWCLASDDVCSNKIKFHVQKFWQENFWNGSAANSITTNKIGMSSPPFFYFDANDDPSHKWQIHLKFMAKYD